MKGFVRTVREFISDWDNCFGPISYLQFFLWFALGSILLLVDLISVDISFVQANNTPINIQYAIVIPCFLMLICFLSRLPFRLQNNDSVVIEEELSPSVFVVWLVKVICAFTDVGLAAMAFVSLVFISKNEWLCFFNLVATLFLFLLVLNHLLLSLLRRDIFTNRWVNKISNHTKAQEYRNEVILGSFCLLVFAVLAVYFIFVANWHVNFSHIKMELFHG
jgi:hypothetical protein